MLFSDDKHHLDKAHNNAGYESGGFQIEVPADGGKIQAVRVHGPYECFPMEKNARRENGVQDKHKEPCLKDGAREPVRLVFEDFVQYGIERNDQKGLQRLVDQIKPLHLTDDMERLVLTARGY